MIQVGHGTERHGLDRAWQSWHGTNVQRAEHESAERGRKEGGERRQGGALAKVSALMLGAKEPWIDVSEAQFATNKFKAPMQF